jgi:dTDP-4-dehydrorhamnose 3,5-epimerase
MRIVAADIAGLFLIERDMFVDRRGAFHEAYVERAFADSGLPTHFPQVSDSHSCKDVVRGLHIQLPRAQAKLVRVVAGAVFDVAVDLRPGSATWGRWASFNLSATGAQMLFIPEGFAHGFAALSDSVLIYHFGTPYDPEGQVTIAWDDADLAIDWPVRAPLLSTADAAGMTLSQFKQRFARY